MNSIKTDIQKLNQEFQSQPAEKVLQYFLQEYRDKITLASSLGAEDQVLTDMILKINPEAGIFTLDTGRMFPESYSLIERTNEHYNFKMEVYFPDYNKVQTMVKDKGVNLFYESIENRKSCCHIRKIEPLKRALAGKEVWITGLRRDQSVTRTSNQMVEWDDGNGLIKLNPLIEWNNDEVWDYLRKNNVPYNKLHDKGFPSIGCQPCTRAVNPGEEIRAGRWWWENPDKKECGLHNQAVSKNS